MLVLVAALVAAGAMFRQEMEIHRLRMAVAELTSISSEGSSVLSTATNHDPADVGELRREAAEVQRLRAEVAQLLREKVETSALQASIDKLAVQVSAISGNFNRTSGPIEAAQWVAALPAGQEQNEAALAVIGRWVGSDAAAAATWATQFPEGPLREEAMSLIARQWGLRDWNATAGWLETLPMGPSRDAAIGAFVTSADGYDIRLALEWANRMEEPESRAQRVQRRDRLSSE